MAGLLTGKDITEQLKGKELGERLLIPSVTLKHGEDVFLDGMTVEDAEKLLGVPICPTPSDGAELIGKVLC